jgi:FAD:protein FMN transferase
MFTKSIKFLLIICLVGCSEPTIQKLEGSAQGTTYHISYWSESPVDSQKISTLVEQEFAAIDLLLSNYRPDSIIETFNSRENTDSQEVGAEIVSLVRIAQSVSQISQGCYDLTIKPLFELWGFKGDKLNIPTEAVIKEGLLRTGMAHLEIVDNTHLRKKLATLKLDLSSIAQGYSVERISQTLEKQNIKNYLVEIGGELKTQGHKPDLKGWRVAIEKPLPGTQQSIQKIITLPIDAPTAVMTSGTYRHYFDADGKSYSHILDARSGRPVTHNLVSVTVLHENPSIADAWSTALLCLGREEGLKAANTQHMVALFIEKQNQQLIETRSESLLAAKNIIIH